MKDLINKIIASFEITNKGYSARKLTAFIIVSCIVAAHIKWIALGNFTQLGEIFIIDYTFIAALFGMTTYSAIKNGK